MNNKENFDIVLFSPPSRMINHYRPPIGLLYIGGYLTHHGLSVKVMDVPLKDQIRDSKFKENVKEVISNVQKRMLDDFRNIKTKIVGISCYTPEYFEVVSLAKEIKKIDPSVIVMVGGIHPTFYPEEFFEEDDVIDICVIGEGEVTAYELCRSILGKSKLALSEIKGLAYFDKKENKVVHTAKRLPVDNLDEISFPDYNLVDTQYYTNASPYSIRGVFLRSMYLLASRGCPSQCTFCVAKKLREIFGMGRFRSAESLIKELKYLKEKFAIDSFYFVDDLFTVNKENVKKFCGLLKKEHLGLIWGCSSKVSTVNEDLLKIMASSGCVQIDFGVERGSNEALRLVNKGQTVEMVKDIFRLCHKYKIRTFANLLVNLPKESEKDLEDILKLLDEIKPEIVSLNIFSPYPGTEIYDKGNYKFTKNEYADFFIDASRAIKDNPDKFKFSRHNIDLGEWTRKYSKKYNSVLLNLKFYLSFKYWKVLFFSRRKINYLKQADLLVREFINQKF
ncbi:MAG: radical SAM protein [Candidatus Omnitrophica bacterium]|nr:radical SAM protein [Candidatus Omnitrophota bacterium]